MWVPIRTMNNASKEPYLLAVDALQNSNIFKHMRRKIDTKVLHSSSCPKTSTLSGWKREKRARPTAILLVSNAAFISLLKATQRRSSYKQLF